jgi:hypothetical protein
MKRLIYSLVSILLFASALSVIHQVNRSNQQIHLKKIELQSTEVKLKKLEQDYNKLNTDKASSDAERLKLEQEKKELEAQLQARAILRERNKVYAAQASLPGSCADWITQAGVTDVGSATILKARESGCNPYARNASSGACGIPQALPCSKLGTNDPVAQIKWMQGYVFARYGSWANALAFHYANNWY